MLKLAYKPALLIALAIAMFYGVDKMAFLWKLCRPFTERSAVGILYYFYTGLIIQTRVGTESCYNIFNCFFGVVDCAFAVSLMVIAN